MKGLLKAKSASNQLLVYLSITAVSFFVLGSLGGIIVANLSGVKFDQMEAVAAGAEVKGGVIFLRGMLVVQFFSLFLVPVIVCSYLFSDRPAKFLGLKKPFTPAFFVAGILIMIVAIPLITWLGELNKNVQFPSGIEKWMKAKETEAGKSMEALLKNQSINDLVINLILISALAGIGEELGFRGMLQRFFIRMFRSPWAGIILAAFLFSAIHLQFYGFVPRFILGILLGAAYWYSGSLWVSILGHMFYNGILVVLVYFNPEMVKNETPPGMQNIALIAAISFVLVALIITWMKRNSVAKFEEVYADELAPKKDHPF